MGREPRVLLTLVALCLALAGCTGGRDGGLDRAEVTFDGTSDPVSGTVECAGSQGAISLTGEVRDGAAHVVVRDANDEVAYYKHYEKGPVGVKNAPVSGAVGTWTLTVQSTPLDGGDSGGTYDGTVTAVLQC